MKKVPHKWRYLSKKDKINIPKNYFNLPIKEIEKIRKIENVKEKLKRSAKLQFEEFGNIHTDLTAWIAGYASDSLIREKFGSSKNLRELFIKPLIKNKKIPSSWQDIKRKIKIPAEINQKLSEETGIHIGDGNLTLKNKNYTTYNYSVNGDLINEIIYHKEHILKLMKEIYNIEGFSSIRKDKNLITSNFKSKAIVHFKNKVLRLPTGPKNNIKIPEIIEKDNELMKRCIVGVIDTDFGVNSSMMIKGGTKSNRLFKQIVLFLKKNKLKFSSKKYPEYNRIFITKDSSIKIIEEWSLHNQKHLSKYLVYKEFKKYIPFSTTEERLAIIDSRLGIEDLEKICFRRAQEKKRLGKDFLQQRKSLQPTSNLPTVMNMTARSRPAG
ncbi:MAG: hypothetical protein ABIB47_05970 [Candidatus Woesearchaeota archaeon]